MSQNFKRGNPFRDENRPGDAAGGGTQAESSGTERCLANGCPLPGTVSDSTRGGGPWMCSAHRQSATERWPQISERARAVPWLWRALDRIAQDGESVEFAAQVTSVCNAKGLPALALDTQHETVKQWSCRLRSGAISWLETGECNSVPVGLRGRPAGTGKLAVAVREPVEEAA